MAAEPEAAPDLQDFTVAPPATLEVQALTAEMVQAARRLRVRWVNVHPAEAEGQLLDLERSLAELLRMMARLADEVLTAQLSEGALEDDGPSSEWALRLARDVARLDREAAARDRDIAALSWHQAVGMRNNATRDRNRAALTRHETAMERAAAAVDETTGALERAHGLVALQREIDRARRADGRLVVGFLDVDGLKKVNDTRGHPAGDHLLREAVVAIQSSLRSYDVVLRYGGDEFVYSLAGASRQAAIGRARHVSAALHAAVEGASVSVGFAELRVDDTLSTLVSRADADLYDRRQRTLTAT
ncbi:MAG TPA: GGDEF domain-containing protein [Acidimicrobiales bacterium]|nr:GGDEF domain-containing protein [Acidimicrobiales bacterium]